MRQSMELQRVGQDWATKQEKQPLLIYTRWFPLFLSVPILEPLPCLEWSPALFCFCSRYFPDAPNSLILASSQSILSSFHLKESASVSHSVVSDSLWPLWTVASQAPLPWDFSGKNTRVGCHSLLQGVFLTQGSNLGLLNCKQLASLPSEPPKKPSFM